MNRRRLVICVASVAFAGALVGAWLLVPGESPINEENILRLRPGMPLTDIEAIIGEPGRVERDTCIWRHAGTTIEIEFNEFGLAKFVQRSEEPSLLRKAVWRLDELKRMLRRR